MQNQENIIQAIAAYLQENTIAVQDATVWHLQFKKEIDKLFLTKTAREIAAAIAPHLEASPKKCRSCGVNESRLLHACPYREELYNDEETPCDCCFECTGQCKDRV